MKASGSGDDAIVAVVRELPGRRVVVTADRELRDRSVAAGATILGPGWLLGQLKTEQGFRATRPVQPGGPTSPLAPAHSGAGASIVAARKPARPS